MTTSFPQTVRVMLVDDLPERAAIVNTHLVVAGYEVVSRLPTASGLLFQIEQHRPDIILIDLQSPGRDVLESLSVINAHNPTPVVMFSEEEDPGFIAEAVDAGVSAYLMGSFDAKRVKPVIDVAIAQFKSFQSLRQALDTTRDRLETLSTIDKAKSLLIKQHQFTEEQAHQQLRSLSMDSNLTMQQAAQSVVTILGKNN
ncbi:MAG: ANTAR domain-containing protein [Porticoccaceae bacterium]|jgi:response regulator NasT|nr:ANTAR domain-containing protein [Porticoccaceae bacterium]MDG1200068.1 ANTAR domain-containing protein [Porticoccaceae bacterium]MDG1447574.1 ANTAR domain-containing protein [Porticoccaceae bacterium]MDG1705436.1 ANTAR domain-containing protein [Porticoccaceae bacterium]